MRIVDLEPILKQEVYLDTDRNYYLTLVKDEFDVSKINAFTHVMKKETGISVKVIEGKINGIWELVKK